jgi:hypothetical protein
MIFLCYLLCFQQDTGPFFYYPICIPESEDPKKVGWGLERALPGLARFVSYTPVDTNYEASIYD